MRRIRRLVVVSLMTSDTRIRRIDIITLMTRITVVCNRCMSASQCIIVVMDRECSWLPTWICRMTSGTGIRNIDSNMVGIGRLVIDAGMTF